MADGKTTIEIRLRSAADVSGVNQMQQAIHGLEGAQQRAATSSGNMGQALLQGSRALQDLQYGLAGAVNNLEGIASAMGLGAGVAGAVTVLAVAIQTLGPKVLDWLRSLDKEGAKLEILKRAHLGIAEAINQSFNPAEEAAVKASEAFTEQLEKEKTATNNNKAAIDGEIASLRLRNQIKDTSEEYAQRMKIESVRASKLSPEETAKQEAAINLEFANQKAARAEELARQEEAAARMKIDQDKKLLAAQQKELASKERIAENAETMKHLIDPNNPGSITGIQQQIRDHEKARLINTTEVYTPEVSQKEKDLRAQLAARQAQLGAFAGQLPGGVLDISGTEAGKARNEAVIAELKREIEALKAEVRTTAGGVSKAQTAFDQGAELRTLQAQQRAQQLEATQRDIMGRAGLNPAAVPSAQPRLPWELPGLPGALPGLPAGQRPLGLNDNAMFPPLDSVRAPKGAPPAAFGSNPFGGGEVKAAGQKTADAITNLKDELLEALGIAQKAAETAAKQIKNSSGRTGS